jgi:hypothetical protein
MLKPQLRKPGPGEALSSWLPDSIGPGKKWIFLKPLILISEKGNIKDQTGQPIAFPVKVAVLQE